MRKKSNDELAKIIKPELEKKGIVYENDEMLARICGLMKERVSFPKEILEQGKYFFEAPQVYDVKTVKKKWKENSPNMVADLIAVFSNTAFNAYDLEEAFKTYIEEKELGFGPPMIAIRLAITGIGGGPSLFDIMEVIGKEESIERLNSGIKNIKKETIA